MRIRTGHKPDDWKDAGSTREPEPADLDAVMKFDLSPSWKEQNHRRWEKLEKAKAS